MAQTVVPPAVSVQRTAPQLVAFAGSPANFQNLVNGLAQGSTVQISTVLPDGSTQIVTFTPAAAMTPTQIAQVLESARQRLISLGIGNPTAEQIAVTLMGGVVPTAFGGSQVPGVLNPQNPPSAAVQAQANAAFGSSAAAGATSLGSTATSTTPTTPSTITPPVNVQIFPGPAASTATILPRVNTSDSPTPAGATSRSPTPPTPTLPGPEASANPTAPGASPTPIAGAPAATTPPAVTPPATTPPSSTPATAQPGNASSGLLRAR